MNVVARMFAGGTAAIQFVACSPTLIGSLNGQSTTLTAAQQFALAEAQNGFGGSGATLNIPVSAPMCWGQDGGCTSGWINYPSPPGNPTSTNLNTPYSIGAYIDINDSVKLKFFITDRLNNRILIFNQIPTSPSAVADVVLGQGTGAGAFTTNIQNYPAGGTTTSQYGFNQVSQVSVCPNGQMFVADRSNNRVLGYNKVPTTNGTAPDFVIGQSSWTGNSWNAPASASTLSLPNAIHCINNMLFVVEKAGNRISVFNPIPTSAFGSFPMPSASFVIGEPDFVSYNSGNLASQSLMYFPYEAIYDGTSLYVADGGNNRVLVYTPIPTAMGAVASAVLGQPNFNTGLANQAGTAPNDYPSGQNTLDEPESFAYQNGWLAVSDDHNCRIMFYTTPVTTNQNASYQFGQPNWAQNPNTNGCANYTPNVTTPNTITYNRGIIFGSGATMWGADFNYSRLLVFALPFTP